MATKKPPEDLAQLREEIAGATKLAKKVLRDSPESLHDCARSLLRFRDILLDADANNDDDAAFLAVFYMGVFARELEITTGGDGSVTPGEQELLDAIREAGGVDSQKELLAIMANRPCGEPSLGTTKIYLANLKRRGRLVSQPSGRGYRIPE